MGQGAQTKVLRSSTAQDEFRSCGQNGDLRMTRGYLQTRIVSAKLPLGHLNSDNHPQSLSPVLPSSRSSSPTPSKLCQSKPTAHRVEQGLRRDAIQNIAYTYPLKNAFYCTCIPKARKTARQQCYNKLGHLESTPVEKHDDGKCRS